MKTIWKHILMAGEQLDCFLVAIRPAWAIVTPDREMEIGDTLGPGEVKGFNLSSQGSPQTGELCRRGFHSAYILQPRAMESATTPYGAVAEINLKSSA